MSIFAKKFIYGKVLVFVLAGAYSIAVSATEDAVFTHKEEDQKSNFSTEGQWSAVVNFFGGFFPSTQQSFKRNYDVTLVGFVNKGDSIGNHPSLIKQCLGQEIKINFLSTRDIPQAVEDAQLGLPRLNGANTADIGGVSILTDILADRSVSPFKVVPNSIIKMAYTMFESTEIPSTWVTILNTSFDAAIVPNDFLVDVYKKCGVQIPLFVLPLPLELNDFLKFKERKRAHKPFTFGFSGGFWDRKNHMRLLEAFAAEFGNRSDVRLILHGRFGEEKIIKALADKITEYNISNVELLVKPLTRTQYISMFKSFDCYVSLSKGEGMSITPYEALACAKPCVVTNNTAQKTICNSGAVRSVRSDILVPAHYDSHYQNSYITDRGVDYSENFLRMRNQELHDYFTTLGLPGGCFGYQFDCLLEDACDALRDVYEHYSDYLKKAKNGREWVKQYTADSLKQKYCTLVKPNAVVLGKINSIDDTVLRVNSADLYGKYLALMEN